MERIGYFIRRIVGGKLRTWDGKKFVDHGKGCMVFGTESQADDIADKIRETGLDRVGVQHIRELPCFIYHPVQCTSRCCESSGEELDQIPYEELFNKITLPDLLAKYSKKRGRDFIVWKGSDNCTCLGCLKDFVEGKIDKWGKRITFVDVKCPECSKINNVEMQYLVHKLNCRGCHATLTVDHRVDKIPFNMNYYR